MKTLKSLNSDLRQLSKLDPLSPYNWDFRPIPERALKSVIMYEYRRSWGEFRNQMTKTLEGKIGRRRIRDHLLDYWSHPTEDSEKNLFKKISKVVWETWKLHKTGKVDYNDFPIIYQNIYCHFPAPFTWLIEKEHFVIKNAKRPYHWLYSPVKIVPKNVRGFNPGGYHMWIQFNAANNETLVSQFASWLAHEAKKHRTRNLHGKASSPPWHKLKQLAAKRLADGGLNYNSAQDLVRKTQKENSCKDYFDVLPCYTSLGAWNDAIKTANLFLDSMTKNNLNDEWKYHELYNI